MKNITSNTKGEKRSAKAARVVRWVTTSTLGILLAMVATAQPEGKGMRHRTEPGQKLEHMERLLDLAPDQVEALEAVFEAHRAATEGDREVKRENRLALKEALGADSPDALTVGELMIEGKNLREAGKESIEALRVVVADVLTDEQEARWEGFQQGRRGGRQAGHGGPGSKRRPGHRQWGGPPRS